MQNMAVGGGMDGRVQCRWRDGRESRGQCRWGMAAQVVVGYTLLLDL